MASAAVLVFSCGVVFEKCQIFPVQLYTLAKDGYDQISGWSRKRGAKSYFIRSRNPHRPVIFNSPEAHEGLNFVTRIAADGQISVIILDLDGARLHEWKIDWFEIWPDASHVPDHLIPLSRPGTHAHGAVLLENGDLIFNFEHLGLVCLDLHGGVLWRLPYQTHHSVTRSSDGNLWVCGQKEYSKPHKQFPNWIPPFTEDTLLEVTAQGKIVNEWSVVDLLLKNGLEGLLFIGSRENNSTKATGDVLHLNDVEPFPSHFEEGFFKKDDVMVSLRNINTIFVFNRESGKIKFIRTGDFLRQHDPDFIDGDTFSVFDNRLAAGIAQSRILIVSAKDQTVNTYYQGTRHNPFYTNIMGKHQWLPNGNLLITESRNGRAFEIDKNGKIVWEYNNYVSDGVVGLMEEVTRLPTAFAPLFKNPKANRQVSHLPNRPTAKDSKGG
ncbi:MAG: hypothetical protein GX594_19105 [Pirellulaceae bacterium]|nr:hypothetical protein [Pirellulaceae bacterium]